MIRLMPVVFLLLMLSLSSLRATPGLAADIPVQVTFSGQPAEFEVPPIIREGRTFVPIRFVVERIQAKVTWDGMNRQVRIVDGETAVVLTIGGDQVSVGGQSRQIDVAPFIYRDRTMVPLRFVAETFGFFVHYDEQSQTVKLVPPSGKAPAQNSGNVATGEQGAIMVTAPPGVKAAERFTAEIQFRGVRQAKAAAVMLKFDPALLAVVEITSGRILEGLTVTKRFDNEAGTLLYITALPGPDSFSGDGTYFTAVFEALQPGESRIEVSADPSSRSPLANASHQWVIPALTPAAVLISE